MTTPNSSFKCYVCGFWTPCIKTINQHMQTCTRSGSVTPDTDEIELWDEVPTVLAREQEKGHEAKQKPEELDDPQSNYGWPTAATQLLIEAYRDHKHDFSSPNKKKYIVWKGIAEKLQKRGYDVDGPTCDTKMRSLKRRYKLIKDRARKTGQGASRPWQFYTAMDDLLDGDQSVRPIALNSSLTVEQCMKEKEDLQRKYEQLHELFLKEKNEHEEKLSALHEKIEKILVRHKEEIQEIHNRHQEQLIQLLLNKK